ncbi:MAG TPA: L,D-transpeptidase family protein [Gemmatimonadales bacterium]|nr:L,D-transpeptidase family protein [Gemmatimonadales bacterium]
MRRWRWLGAALAAGLVVLGCHKDDTAAATVALRSAVAAKPPPRGVPAAHWRVVRTIYADRAAAPLWLDGDRPSDRARELVQALCHADAQGLRPRDYDLAALERALAAAEAKDHGPAALAELDLRLTALFVDYGGDLLAGRLDPRAVDSGWYIKDRRRSVDSTLRVAAQAPTFAKMLTPLAPGRRDYADLVDWLARYRRIAEAGGWPAIPGKGPIRPGDRGPRVAALRARLAATGDLDSAAVTAGAAPYDRTLAAAVARFRARHGLGAEGAAGGIVDAATLAALDVPAESRVRQIELNLERLRWLPHDFGPRYVLVNIPDYQLHAYDGGKEVLTMRVIVGKQYENATPVFADTMSYVVFHPRWNVPRSIVANEIIPKMQADVRWAAEHGYEIVDPKRDTVVDPGSIDWKGVDTATFAFGVRQKPGPDNSLGRIKFMFPNSFDIYLHDTPAKQLFDRRERDFSHGCVRVEEPERLAQYVFAGDPAWSAGKIHAALVEDTATVQAKVPQRLPVYLVYLTAFSRNGTLEFRDDPYGADRRALARLGRVEADTATRSRCARLLERLKR